MSKLKKLRQIKEELILYKEHLLSIKGNLNVQESNKMKIKK